MITTDEINKARSLRLGEPVATYRCDEYDDIYVGLVRRPRWEKNYLSIFARLADGLGYTVPEPERFYAAMDTLDLDAEEVRALMRSFINANKGLEDVEIIDHWDPRVDCFVRIHKKEGAGGPPARREARLDPFRFQSSLDTSAVELEDGWVPFPEEHCWSAWRGRPVGLLAAAALGVGAGAAALIGVAFPVEDPFFVAVIVLFAGLLKRVDHLYYP